MALVLYRVNESYFDKFSEHIATSMLNTPEDLNG